ASGDFAAGQVVQIAPNDVDVATVARYSPTSSVLAAAGMTGDFRTLLSYERGPTGSWAVQFVDAVATQFGSVYADGVGTLADGTAVITSHGAEGLILHRRTGLQWSDYRTLVAGEVIAGAVAFPPAGSPAPFAVAVYQRSGTQAQRGALVSLTDGTASADTELLPVGGIDYSEVAFDPDGTRGTILLVDADGRRAWIATFEGAAFTTATELRPDRVFETGPHIVQHPCGGTMILHVTRAPTDAEWSAPAVLEPLADFRVP
ncbi:MAG TPA: hypothetical protein VM734_26260, partial [Kofleriaceae bacterium]|nr:hypothetical protein [Kofleriaceae bacterium]